MLFLKNIKQILNFFLHLGKVLIFLIRHVIIPSRRITMNILVLDDEKEIADLVELYLNNEDYQIYKFYDPHDALQCIKTQQLDLAILDIMVGDIDGFKICQLIREYGYHYPVIMLTAKISENDKITGLTLGADDYITKPFHPLELVARVKSALRRYTKYNQPAQQYNVIYIDGLEINPFTHQCRLYDKEITLTPKEFDILLYLANHQGQVVSSEKLFQQIWKEQYLNSNNTVMVHIRRIREKLHDNPKKPQFIKTVWGVGYKIEKR